MRYLLGIDVGTSGTKTVIFETNGNPIAEKTVEYPMYQPFNGWAEQNPSDWWNAVVEGISAVIGKINANPFDISGIGLSGQMHGLVMLDKYGNVLRPSIIWCDQRTNAECDQMSRVIGNQRIIEITANPPTTSFTASKILWVQNNEPEIYERCVHILLPKDYIRYKLTGEFATEVSDASGMQLMDIAMRDWSSEVLEKLSIDKSLLARMYESPEVTGVVNASAAETTGLKSGTPVVGGAGDNSAVAIGTGVVSEGNAFTTIGSSAVVYAISDKVRIDFQGRVNSFCASVPGKWTVMSCTQAAGLSLKWLRDTFCLTEIIEAKKANVDPYVIMDKMAEKVPIGANKLIFLPYLMGERSPHPDPNCRGVFFGLSAMHGREHLIRAVLEGVAYSQLECVEVFREMGVPVSDMIVTGGGGKSPLWRQMFADLYRCQVNTLSFGEGGALGAALLAGVGTGVYSSVEQATKGVVKKKSSIQPIEANAEFYLQYYELYKSLYPILKSSFDQLSSIS
ncbi:MAG: xylulokinase [Ruminococcaceae bacterium]|nr:xylulokinase [Oscillospiraceae bacterium]